MTAITDALAAGDTGALPAPPVRVATQLRAWAEARGVAVSPAVARQAVAVWTRLHGHVSLEIEGSFGVDGARSEAALRRRGRGAHAAGR